MKKVGLYRSSVCKNDRLCEILSVDDALHKIDSFDVSGIELFTLKNKLLKGSKVPLKIGSPYNLHLKLFDDVPDEEFYILHEKTLVTLMEVDSCYFDSYGYYEKFRKEELKLISKVFYERPLNDLIVLWLREGICKDLKTAIFESCSNMRELLTATGKVIRDKPDIFDLRYVPDYVLVDINTEYYLLEVKNGDFFIKRCVELKQ